MTTEVTEVTPPSPGAPPPEWRRGRPGIAGWISKVLGIAGREVDGYLVSPTAYIATSGFLLVSGYFFSMMLIAYHNTSLRNWFFNTAILALFMMPVLTMRLIAEEKKQRTWALLMTSPLSPVQIVLGKYLASLGFASALIGMTLAYPYIIHSVGGRPDWGPVATGYLGLWLLCSSLVAIGLFASSLTENLLVAAIIGFSMNMFFWIIGWSEVYSPGWRDVVMALSLLRPYEEFVKGVIDLKSVFYYLSVTGVFLFAAIRVVHSQRWNAQGG